MIHLDGKSGAYCCINTNPLYGCLIMEKKKKDLLIFIHQKPSPHCTQVLNMLTAFIQQMLIVNSVIYLFIFKWQPLWKAGKLERHLTENTAMSWLPWRHWAKQAHGHANCGQRQKTRGLRWYFHRDQYKRTVVRLKPLPSWKQQELAEDQWQLLRNTPACCKNKTTPQHTLCVH